MKSKEDPRHLSRIIAFQTLFNSVFSKSTVFSSSDISKIDKNSSFNKKLFKTLITGVSDNSDQIYEIIKKASLERPFSKINTLDMQILRIAVYEGFIGKITPPKVSIDEAIEIAKDFGDKSSDKFVSGVLGNLMK